MISIIILILIPLNKLSINKIDNVCVIKERNKVLKKKITGQCYFRKGWVRGKPLWKKGGAFKTKAWILKVVRTISKKENYMCKGTELERVWHFKDYLKEGMWLHHCENKDNQSLNEFAEIDMICSFSIKKTKILQNGQKIKWISLYTAYKKHTR